MKTAAIMSGIAVAVLVMMSFRKGQKAAITEEKLHELQDKFKSLDAA